jgi:nitronate monooxygenase
LADVTLSTPLCETLGIDYPIVQAPIGSATRPELAAAVSNAGGLGTLAVTWRSPEKAAEFVERTHELTDAPFGVNIVLDPESKEVATEDHLDAVLGADVPIVSFSFGDATPYIDRVHDAGAQVLVTVGSANEAERAADAGADAIVAQGWEAGGHVQSEVATLPLVPRVDDAVDVPVIAAGGIADGRGVAAVLAAGADGAWLGTRFVATEEAAVESLYRDRIVEADETDTLYSELFDEGWEGMPHRVIRNSTVETWEEAGRPESGERPGEGEVIAEYPGGYPIERYGDDLPMEGVEGDLEALALYAGQSSGLTGDIQPAGEVVEELVEETEARIEATADLID